MVAAVTHRRINALLDTLPALFKLANQAEIVVVIDLDHAQSMQVIVGVHRKTVTAQRLDDVEMVIAVRDDGPYALAPGRVDDVVGVDICFVQQVDNAVIVGVTNVDVVPMDVIEALRAVIFIGMSVAGSRGNGRILTAVDNRETIEFFIELLHGGKTIMMRRFQIYFPIY